MIKINTRILSPTAINTYLSCPRKFYLRYIKKFRTKPSIYLIRGQIVHQTLHKFYKNHPRMLNAVPLSYIRTELIKIFNRHWDRALKSINCLGLTDAQIKFYHDNSEIMLFNFSHWFYKNDMPVPDLTEAKVLSKNLGLMGIIDAVHKTPGKLILVDYKTSKCAEITEDTQRQAALYSLLYQDRFKKTPDAVWIHFLIEPGDPQPIFIDEPLLEYGKILIQSIREKTGSDNESDYPCNCGGYCERDFVIA